MTSSAITLPKDITTLKEFAYNKCIEANTLAHERDLQSDRVKSLEQQVEHLSELVRLLRHQQFGSSSNTLKALQVDLFDNEAALQALLDEQEEKHDEKAEIEVGPFKKKKPAPKPKLPAHILSLIHI